LKHLAQNNLVYFVNEIKTSFVLNDIKRLAEKNEKFYLFSIDKLEGKELLPDHVIVYEEFISWNKFKPLRVFLRNFFSLIGIYIFECIKLKKILSFKNAIALLCSNIFKADCVIEILRTKSDLKPLDIKNSLFYSFWFYDCIFISWLRKRKIIDKAIVRTHSGDLYEEHISIKDKILFRNFQFKYLDKILPVSNMGTHYLKNRYPLYKNKIEKSFLGSIGHGLNPYSTDNVFTIVSCASFRHHKRIHKIAEMLNMMDFPIIWYHIGDERLDSKDPKIGEYIKNKEILKGNNLVRLLNLGEIQNADIFNFYKTHPVNLFISLSEAEGIPVSMMEAISFGIPIISTDVGGCNEIVNEKTGVLIPLETEMEEVARLIKEFKTSEKNTENYRTGVRKFWEENFNSDSNYKDFFKLIEN
jgi:glycosyltransferase involved in cell wall biosynthesis